MDLRINLSIQLVSNSGFHYNYYFQILLSKEGCESGLEVKRPKKGAVYTKPLFLF
jgi:hypothetical protein